MYLYRKQGVPWPPPGWKHFSSIKKPTGQAISKDPRTALIQGLSYHVEANPVYINKKERSYLYSIRIDGWTYSIQNESQEFPVMRFTLLDKARGDIQKSPYMSNLKIQSRLCDINEGKAHRVIMATLFFMKQIDGENVPDYEQVLKLYRLTPSSMREDKTQGKRPSLLTKSPSKRLYGFYDEEKIKQI